MAADRQCKNCGNTIIPSRRSPSGWTHGTTVPWWKKYRAWQGIRCIGSLTGAEPKESL